MNFAFQARVHISFKDAFFDPTNQINLCLYVCKHYQFSVNFEELKAVCGSKLALSRNMSTNRGPMKY